jgi:toxin ParE1/3/4
MARSKVEFHKEARREALAALDWYLERSEQVAERFLAEISRAVDTVSAAPQRWPEYGHDTRGFVLHQFPFAIIYRILASSVQIVAIAHMRRRPGYWKGRTSGER